MKLQGGGMYPFRRKLLINAFKLFDLLNMGMCLILSVLVFSNNVSLPSFSQIGLIEIKILNLVFFIISLLTWKIILTNFKLYRSKRLSEQSQEISDVLKATSIGALLILIEAIFFRINFITIPVIFFFWICCTTITITSRFSAAYQILRPESAPCFNNRNKSESYSVYRKNFSIT
jgi:FlaA1/EpsC-like NDP-sugar epimerase